MPKSAEESEIRFTPRAQAVISASTALASELGHSEVSSEHILLALIQESGAIASRTLADLGLDPSRVREMLVRLHPPEPKPEENGLEAKTGDEFEKVMWQAGNEQRRMGHDYLGTEHILLGVVRIGEGQGMDILRRLGVTPEQIRRQTRRILGEMPVLRPSAFSFSLPSVQESTAASIDIELLNRIQLWQAETQGKDVQAAPDQDAKRQDKAGAVPALTAPISLPPSEDMVIRLVPSFSLERLEEYRSDEGIALLVLGLFAGAFFGLLTNIVTQDVIDFSATEIVLLVLLGGLSSASAYWIRRVKKRAARVRDDIFSQDRQIPSVTGKA